jgi:hypothetical protein
VENHLQYFAGISCNCLEMHQPKKKKIFEVENFRMEWEKAKRSKLNICLFAILKKI